MQSPRNFASGFALAAFALPSAAGAAPRPAIPGEDDGIRVSKNTGGYVFHCSKKADKIYRSEIGGKRVAFACTKIRKPSSQFSGWTDQEAGTTDDRPAPKRRGPLSTGVSTKQKADYCTIELAKPSSGLIAQVAVSAAGRVYLESRMRPAI
jgi:hypothetical protein